MTINLFSLYLMNFMLHTMLDATGVVLRVHYNSMKSDILFLQGNVRTLCRWGGPFSYLSNKISSFLQQYKNYKNWLRFSKVTITNVLPPFFVVHSVHSLYELSELSKWLCHYDSIVNIGLSSCKENTYCNNLNLPRNKVVEVRGSFHK